jgi:soluble lytic murein transglycosylase-like protein
MAGNTNPWADVGNKAVGALYKTYMTRPNQGAMQQMQLENRLLDARYNSELASQNKLAQETRGLTARYDAAKNMRGVQEDLIKSKQNQSFNGLLHDILGGQTGGPPQLGIDAPGPNIPMSGGTSYPMRDNVDTAPNQIVGQSGIDYIQKLAMKNNVDPTITRNMFGTETNYGTNQGPSPAGALGPMQTMPGTLVDPGYGVTPASDMSQAEMARVGVEYIAAMNKKYGDPKDAVAAYNWGPGNMDKWIASGRDINSMPLETRNYIEKTVGHLSQEEANMGQYDQLMQGDMDQPMDYPEPLEDMSVDPYGRNDGFDQLTQDNMDMFGRADAMENDLMLNGGPMTGTFPLQDNVELNVGQLPMDVNEPTQQLGGMNQEEFNRYLPDIIQFVMDATNDNPAAAGSMMQMIGGANQLPPELMASIQSGAGTDYADTQMGFYADQNKPNAFKAEAIQFEMSDGSMRPGVFADGEYKTPDGQKMDMSHVASVNRIGQPTGTNAQLSASEGAKVRDGIQANKQVKYYTSRLRAIIDPSVLGATGDLRQLLSGASEQGDALISFITSLAGENTQYAQSVGTEFDNIAPKNITGAPTASVIDYLALQLSYAEARAADPGGKVSDNDEKVMTRAISIGKQLNDVASINAVLDEIDAKADFNMGELNTRVGNKSPAQPAQNTIEPGTVEDGYEFQGGDPSEPNNWVKAQ